jgi:hypothetical protein
VSSSQSPLTITQGTQGVISVVTTNPQVIGGSTPAHIEFRGMIKIQSPALSVDFGVEIYNGSAPADMYLSSTSITNMNYHTNGLWRYFKVDAIVNQYVFGITNEPVLIGVITTTDQSSSPVTEDLPYRDMSGGILNGASHIVRLKANPFGAGRNFDIVPISFRVYA